MYLILKFNLIIFYYFQQELEIAKDLLFQKYNILNFLEFIIDRDQKDPKNSKIQESSFKLWAQGLIKIR